MEGEIPSSTKKLINGGVFHGRILEKNGGFSSAMFDDTGGYVRKHQTISSRLIPHIIIQLKMIHHDTNLKFQLSIVQYRSV